MDNFIKVQVNEAKYKKKKTFKNKCSELENYFVYTVVSNNEYVGKFT